jgi:hypothetical protein
MPAHRLKDVTVKEVSFVPEGDNPEADILIFKAKPMKTEGGIEYPADAFAYVPDPAKPSTWKLRLWDDPESKETAAQVGRAVAALGAGFRGQKVQIPAVDLPGVKRKVLAAWRRTHEGEPPAVLTKQEGGGGMTPEEELQAALDEANAKNEKLMMELEALKGQLEAKEGTGAEGESEEDMVKAMPESMRKNYEEAIQKAKEQAAALDKMRDDQLEKEWITKAKEADLTEEVGKTLKNLAKENPETAGVLYDEMARLSKAVNAGDLLKEKGGNGGQADAKTRIDTMAKERAEEQGISYEKAYAAIYKENAQLRKELKEEGK